MPLVVRFGEIAGGGTSISTRRSSGQVVNVRTLSIIFLVFWKGLIGPRSMQILPGVSASPVRPVSQVEHTSPDWVRAPSPNHTPLRRRQRRPLFNSPRPPRFAATSAALCSTLWILGGSTLSSALWILGGLTLSSALWILRGPILSSALWILGGSALSSVLRILGVST